MKPIAVLLSFAVIALPMAAEAATVYRITDIATRGGGFAINELGAVAGAIGPQSQGFVSANGHLTVIPYLPLPAGTPRQAEAWGINDLGAVVGYSTFSGPGGGLSFHGFHYAGGRLTDLGDLDASYSYATGVNNGGVITGSVNVPPVPNTMHAFTYSGGTMTLVDNGGEPESFGYAINNSGQVAGKLEPFNGHDRAFLYSPASGVHDLGTLGGRKSAARAINDSGDVVGWSTTTNDARTLAFIYRDGVMAELGTFGSSYSFSSMAYGINNYGDVVGSARINGVDTSFVRYADGSWADLNKSLDVVSGAGWRILEARDINGTGQITGVARAPDGLPHAFVLDLCTTCQGPPPGPIPEPAAWVLLTAGLGLLTIRQLSGR